MTSKVPRKVRLIVISSLLVFVLGVPGAPELASPSGRSRVVKAEAFSLELTPDGRIAGLVIKKDRLRRDISGGTRLAGCTVLAEATSRKKPGGVLESEKTMTDQQGNKCRLVERFSPEATGIRWEIEATGLGKPWTTAIETSLQYPTSGNTRFWSPWGDSRQGSLKNTESPDLVARGVLPGVPVGDWADPLMPMPFTDATLWFGAPAFSYENPGLAYIPFQPDLFCIPLATVIEEDRDLGLSLALSPADPYLELALSTRANGEIVFSRQNHRIQENRPLNFTAHLVVHEGDWRGGMRWMTGQYPEYFDPSVPGTEELAGTSAYSVHEQYLNTEMLKRMAFRTNWKASWDFPYPGMFLPPVGRTELWPRFGGGLTSTAHIAEYIRSMRSLGFYVLNYFNVTEVGTQIFWPPPPRRAHEDSDLWKDANDFVHYVMADAILLVPSRVKPESLAIYPRTKVGGPYYTWQGGIVMDPGEPVYQRFLLDQARRHIEEFPESSGICIDRLDWLRMYNERRDDGASWFEGLPVRALANSWRDLMSKLGPLMHQPGKAIFINNHTKRIDLAKHTDGYYDEFTYRGVPLNLTALMGVRKTALGWTEGPNDLKADPDAFFQKYLYLGVYPMAPFPLNDHSIEPRPTHDRWYLDYGPLLDAMRGKTWALSPHAARVENLEAKANVFRVPGGYAVPVVFGRDKKSVRVILRNLEGAGPKSVCTALHPGQEGRLPVAIVSQGADLVLEVPLVRGCAMVRIEQP